LLKKADLNINLQSLDGFAVGLGPGSFTGLRVGLGAVKALAYANNKPVAGISSLDLIAHNVKQVNTAKNICVITDARRSMVYAGFYVRSAKGMRRKGKYVLTGIQDVLDKTQKDCIILGDGVAVFRDEILERIKQGAPLKIEEDHKFWYPKASSIVPLALPLFKEGKTTPVEKLLPQYMYPETCQIR